MTTMRTATVENSHGETYLITVRKHSDAEITNDYGFPYSIKVSNINPETFDLNNRVFLYDAWQTAYKRFYELLHEYRTIKLAIWKDVDARTGRAKI